MVSVRGLLLVSLVALGQWVCAQDRYMVFFSDKNETTYSLNEPETFLSQRAIDRKLKHQIALDSMDLPVNETYVDAVRNTGADVYFQSRWLNAVLVQMNDGQFSAVSALSFVDSVNYIAPEPRLSRDKSNPVIAETFKEIDVVNADSHDQMDIIGAKSMHRDGYKGEGVLIAVFDAGFRGINEYKPFEHLFKEQRVLGVRDFVRNSGNVYQYHSHGSSVLSTIAASYGDDMTGSAPDASFLLCVTEDVTTEYRIEEYNWLLAAEYADSAGADVINGSLGYSTFDDASMNYTYEDMTGDKTIISRGASLAVEKGMVVVVSAGNSGNNKWTYITSPADTDEILAVGSVTKSRNKAAHSSFGPTPDGRIKPDVCAMGQSTTIFYPSGDMGVINTGNGTSYAAPQIAGLVAGVWQANPDLNNKKIMQIIRESGSQYAEPDTLLGYGIANYNRISLDNVITASDVLTGNISVYPNPFKDERIHIDFGGLDLSQKLEVNILDPAGRLIYDEKYRSAKMPSTLEIEIPTTVNGVYYLILRTRSFEKTVKLIKN